MLVQRSKTNLNWRVLRTQQKPTQRLVLLGSGITAAGGALLAHGLLGMATHGWSQPADPATESVTAATPSILEHAEPSHAGPV